MKITFVFAATALVGFASAADSGLHPFPQSLADVSVYTKLKSNLIGLWQEETGFSSRLLTAGRFGVAGNIAFIADYPLKTPFPSKWTAGLTASYRLATGAYTPAVYSKLKSNLIGKAEQETGLSALLAKFGSVRCSGNAAYLFRYPYKSHSAPSWTVGITLSVPLR